MKKTKQNIKHLRVNVPQVLDGNVSKRVCIFDRVARSMTCCCCLDVRWMFANPLRTLTERVWLQTAAAVERHLDRKHVSSTLLYNGTYWHVFLTIFVGFCSYTWLRQLHWQASCSSQIFLSVFFLAVGERTNWCITTNNWYWVVDQHRYHLLYKNNNIKNKKPHSYLSQLD